MLDVGQHVTALLEIHPRHAIATELSGRMDRGNGPGRSQKISLQPQGQGGLGGDNRLANLGDIDLKDCFPVDLLESRFRAKCRHQPR